MFSFLSYLHVQASVPVIVHLPEAVVSSASHWVPQSTSFAILISFVSILGVLALIIVLLILYIQKKYVFLSPYKYE